MSHKPNPFDFVPFVEIGPNLYPLKGLVSSDNLQTGYLTVRIKALTPVHIVGDQGAVESEPLDKQERIDGKKDYRISESKFFRRGGTVLIPSSTIRGCLRSFLEAATNGWVSQCTPCYAEDPGKRRYGFKVIATTGTESNGQEENLSLPVKYVVPRTSGELIDVASFLFGYVAENEGALRGRIVIEDAEIQEDNLGLNDETGRYLIPDVQATAFMGGPLPSASSWWYLYPHKIQLNEIKDKNGVAKLDRGGNPIVGVEFIGSGYRGRKFYYHQSPYESYAWYKNRDNWPEDENHEIYSIPVECLKPGLETKDFRIYFEEIPEPLLKILILALTPGLPEVESGKPTLRHKFGYGKAYGYGSIEFTITGGKIRGEKDVSIGSNYIDLLQKEVISSLWDFHKLNEIGIANYLHKESLDELAKILWYEDPMSLKFYYPTFDKKGFKSLVSKEDILSVLTVKKSNKIKLEKKIKLTPQEGKDIAQKLYDINRKLALHFEVYQENADNFNEIQQRTLNHAE